MHDFTIRYNNAEIRASSMEDVKPFLDALEDAVDIVQRIFLDLIQIPECSLPVIRQEVCFSASALIALSCAIISDYCF